MYIGGEWLMLYVENYKHRAQCIGAATTSNGITFADASFQYCSPKSSHGYLDPSLFIDSSGNIYFEFSEQWMNSAGTPCGDGPDSLLWIQQLSSTGLQTVGSPTQLFTWSEAESIQGLPGSPFPGGSACLENPQLVNDFYNTYDLTFSMGTWTSNSTYLTGEVACLALNNTGSGCDINPAAGGVLINPGGGASTLTTHDPGYNYMIYAKWNSNVTLRQDWVGPTHSCDPNPGPCV